MDVEKIIQQVIDDKRQMEIVYHGGSAPGARRRIGPISISNGKVRAKCYESNAVKQFVIAKIEPVIGHSADINPDYPDYAKIEYETLAQVLEAAMPIIQHKQFPVKFDAESIKIEFFEEYGNKVKRWRVVSSISLEWVPVLTEEAYLEAGELGAPEEGFYTIEMPAQKPWRYEARTPHENRVIRAYTLKKLAIRFLNALVALEVQEGWQAKDPTE